MNTPKNTRKATAHIAPFGLRLQPELKARAEKSAAENGRSLNAEIACILRDIYDLQDHHQLQTDLYEEEESSSPMPDLVPKSAAEERISNLLIASAEENAQLRTLLQQNIELMRQVIGQKSVVSKTDEVDSEKVSAVPKRIKRTPPKPKG